MAQKIIGTFASMTQEIGSAHLGIQIADKVIHWFSSDFALIKDFKSQGATALFYPQDSNGNEVPVIQNTPENRKAICRG